jgi:hypothetical protein
MIGAGLAAIALAGAGVGIGIILGNCFWAADGFLIAPDK